MALESFEQRLSITTLQLDNTNQATISIRPLTPVDLFEWLAFETWHRLRLGKKHHVHQGEETITDINLLEIALANLREIKLWKCPKVDEGRIGIDWEWFIRLGKTPWRRYAIQAKRLAISGIHYEHLNHLVGSRRDPKNPPKRQIDVLQSYAQSQRATPLYCFYNHVDLADYNPYWHCNQALDVPQLGCTLTPLNVVDEALKSRSRPSCRTFKHIHENVLTIPWRCLVGCDHPWNKYKTDPAVRKAWGPLQEYEELPPEVARLFRTDDISTARYDTNYPFVPARVLLADIQEIEFERDLEPSTTPALPEIKRF